MGLGLIGPTCPSSMAALAKAASPPASSSSSSPMAISTPAMSVAGLADGRHAGHHARPAIAREWLPKVTAGEAIIGLGLTEPRGGSDAANLILRADKSGNGYRLNGEKNSISFSDQCEAAVIFAGPEGRGRRRGVSAFFVFGQTAGPRVPGWTVSARSWSAADRSSSTTCSFPANADGRENAGFGKSCKVSTSAAP